MRTAGAINRDFPGNNPCCVPAILEVMHNRLYTNAVRLLIQNVAAPFSKINILKTQCNGTSMVILYVYIKLFIVMFILYISDTISMLIFGGNN